jgi:hypothetical protein
MASGVKILMIPAGWFGTNPVNLATGKYLDGKVLTAMATGDSTKTAMWVITTTTATGAGTGNPIMCKEARTIIPFHSLKHGRYATLWLQHPNIAGALTHHNTGGMFLRGPGVETDLQYYLQKMIRCMMCWEKREKNWFRATAT